ncbi:MAG: TAXI family TRAP transporter solute-binding subunit [Desulfocucumaceae bacterium]
MRLKSKSLYLLLAVLVFTLVAAGCGGKDKAAGDTKAPADTKAKDKYSLATAGTGGTYYPMGGGIASVAKDGNIEISVETSGGSAENLRLIQSGETDLAWANASEIYWAWNGQEFFKGQSIKDFRVVAFSWDAIYHWAVPKNSGIKTFADLKGKKLGIGPQGSGAAVFAETYLKAIGMWDKVQPQYLPPEDQATSFKDKKIALFGYFSRVPMSALMDITATMEITLLDPTIEGEKAGFAQKYPFFVKTVIPKGSYKGQEQDVAKYGNPVYLVASTKVPDQVIYDLLKTVYSENGQKRLRQTNKAAEDMTLKTAMKGVKEMGVPLHPGAVKFYTEQKVEMPAGLDK